MGLGDVVGAAVAVAAGAGLGLGTDEAEAEGDDPVISDDGEAPGVAGVDEQAMATRPISAAPIHEGRFMPI